MTQIVRAIFEDGLFRPIDPVPCAEHDRVSLVICSAKANGPATGAIDESSQPELLQAALTDAANLPLESADDGFSGADHDALLYGWQK